MKPALALYTRVSTDAQTTDNQIRALHEVAVQKGWLAHDGVLCVYSDAGISGRKGRAQRPAYDALINDIEARKIGMVICWAVDRVGRSLPELVSFIYGVWERKCGFYAHQQQVDSTTPSGRAFIGMAAVFAEFEVGMTSERIKAGLKRARAEGKPCSKFPPLSEDKKEHIRRLLAEQVSVRKIAAEVGCGHSPIQRIKACAA